MAGPVEGFSPSKFGRQIWGSGQFQRFADQYMAEGDTRLQRRQPEQEAHRQGLRRVRRDAEGLPGAARDAEESSIDEEAFKSDLTFIKAMIHYEIDLALFGVDEARRNLILQDPQARFALSQFGEAQRLTELARNTPRGGGR